ncbi:A24 family peptidase [Bacillus sp. FJAT-47783]|uniref:prepilin peptidase n=1 Tax=Bacillus sp. FJAT-47783 TaxID=2922712 RepID=UPI001FAD0EA3|nr:A24 family peptidase [Bacillus sp. FJAT-47783]
MLFIYLYLFIVGITFGSFFNVVGLRVPKKMSIVTPRSACSQCETTLSWYELIPIFSFVFQKGKCRHCGAKLSVIYPIVEALTGLLFIFSLYKIGWEAELLVSLTLVSLLLIISVSDLSYMLIPNSILLFFFLLLSFERLFIPLSPWYDSLLGAFLGFILLYVIAVLSKGGMGGGDIKLMTVLGVALGMKGVLLTFFLATIIGTIFSIAGMLVKKLHRKSAIPFGPFISIGGLIAYFFQDELLHWYLQWLQ